VSRQALALLMVLGAAATAAAQAPTQAPAPATRPQPGPPGRETASLWAFGDLGYTRFTASESFDATLGAPTAVVFGGGAEVRLAQRIFAGVRFGYFQGKGERVFVHDGERFSLGIPMTVTIKPVLVTAGYRFGGPRSMVRPYVGAGIGWYRYEETSEFATPSEDVSERFTGYHVLGGGEYRLSDRIGLAGEAEWSTVPDALGQDPSGVSAVFDETDLGGVTLRIKLTIRGFGN
jgi:opacity protein-like surface antigen